MRINTFVRPENEKTANKILRKGRGAWGEFVNQALEAQAQYDKFKQTEVDKASQ